jgi:oligoribonuclease
MRFLWLDVETTGLDPAEDSLLELAFAEADLLDPFSVGVIDSHVFRFVATAKLNTFARDMHTKNGLLEECGRSTAVTVREVEDMLLQRVPEVASRDDRTTLAGSSVHFDLSFVRVHMPRLAARLSYRVYDVSAVKLFCESLGMPRLPKAEAHRAADDVRESIMHGRKCERWLRGYGVECLVCEGRGHYLVNAHGPQEQACTDCDGNGFRARDGKSR